ncbi:uncharacterized protein LOC142162670 [Nicotiana tabacum]|uniref:Uncharacterized protein LOC142162670 n=1 Tax=Nicotiana tabacum TaxID=4097 RepID=A0AC58RRC8_TOBAC
MAISPAIVEYESIIIKENTSTVIEVGQVYKDKQTIASAMKHYSVMNNYCLVCVGEDCTWHFKSTSTNNSAMFKVRNFNSLHACSLMDNTYIQHKPTSMVVGSMVIPKYADPKTVYTPKDIQTDMFRLHSYLYILEKTYLGSVVKLKKTDNDYFLYAFVAISTSINDWKYCRPVVIVDRTFLKSAYRGIMLTASTMDTTGSILPLAYAIVDSENEASWKWFRVHATVNRTWTITLNIAESLNAVTKDARELPIVELLEYMRTLLECWTNENLLKAKGTFTYLGFKFNKELEDNRTLSQKLKLQVRASTDYIHTVLDGVRRYIVCLENKRCSCGQFQLDELPYPHALASLRHRDESYYCSTYYMRENLLHTYEIPVNPLLDESKWNVP